MNTKHNGDAETYECNQKLDFIICGDININYLTESSKRGRFDAVLMSYKLVTTVTFPTRNGNNSSSAIDNIFIDTSMFENYTVSPLINRLSDHDVQMIIIHNPQRQLDVHLTRYNRLLIQGYRKRWMGFETAIT